MAHRRGENRMQAALFPVMPDDRDHLMLTRVPADLPLVAGDEGRKPGGERSLFASEDNPAQPRFMLTETGVGYRFQPG